MSARRSSFRSWRLPSRRPVGRRARSSSSFSDAAGAMASDCARTAPTAWRSPGRAMTRSSGTITRGSPSCRPIRSRARIPLMSTAVSAEREAILQTVRDFARKEIRPHVMEWDEKQHFPREVFRSLGELGLLGTIFPEEYGGAGLSTGDYAAIVEELASVDGSIALALAAHTSLGSSHIFQFGTEAQKRRYMPKLTSGEWLAAWGLTEAEAGSDSGGTKSTAVRDRAGWVLNGSKNFITNASVGGVAVLMAVTEPAKGH